MASVTKDNASIPTAVDGCGRSFLSLAESLRSPSRFADQVASEVILDEFDRFKLWAGNIAAHRKGRRSLEHRLRDATQLKAETSSLLASLVKALDNAISIVKGHRLPWDEEIFSDSDSESESSDNRSEHNLQGDTELKQLFASMRSLITSLMRLSMAIREPAPDRQVRSIDKSHFEQHDMGHVQAKFPDIPQYLAERLGRAISSRRQYLTYREVHHEKLSKGIDKLGLEAARTEFTTNSTEATRLQQNENVTVMDDGDDTFSMTSYATSVNATLRAPGLPKEAREKEHYNCPLCYALISIQTTAAWKRHVYQDLHPYCCTFEDCTTADRLYDSRHAWFAHESEAHYSTFQCVEGCSKTFQNETEFEAHVKSAHTDLAAPEIYYALRKTSTRGSSMSEMVHCRLCGKFMTLRAMQKHMGHHHEQLALFALPPNLDDTEEDHEEDQLSSLSNNDDAESDKERLEKEVSDMSDDSDPDEMPDERQSFMNAVESLNVVTERRSTSGYDIQLETEPVSDQKEFTGSASEVEVSIQSVCYCGRGAVRMYDRCNSCLRDAGYQVDTLSDRAASTREHEYAATTKAITQNQQGLNVQIQMDVQDEDGSESQSTNHHKCPHCSADFTKQHDLESHMLTHSQEKPYECPTCQARFKRLLEMSRHSKIHVIERPHTCLKCDRRFARSDTLARHEASCAGRQSRIGIDEEMIDGKDDKGMDGAVHKNEPDENFEDNDNGETGRETIHPLQERSPEDAELIKERERIIYEYELRKSNNKKAGRDNEAVQVTEEDRRFAEEHKHLIDEYEQKKDIKKLERSGREDESSEIAEEEKRIDEARKRLIVEYEQKKKLEKLGRESEARIEGEISKQMARGVESPSIDAGSREAARSSHEYDRFKQQTGLPPVSIAILDTGFDPGFPVSSSSESALRQSNEERAEETAQKEREEKELEESMRKRLKQFGFKEDQINAMTDPQQQKQKQPEEEASLTSSNPFRIVSPPTYPKISRKHLATETLEYYDIPYEYDAADPNYIIVLREMTHKETDILFEHTRRSRKGGAAFFELGADTRGRRRVSDGASNVTITDSSSKTDSLKAGDLPNRDYILDLADSSRPSISGDGSSPKRTQKHPATFQCTLCPKRFTRAQELRMHLRTHTDERPFVCSICGKKFARQQDRKNHEGLHSGMPGADVRGPQKSSESSIAGGESSEQKTSNIEAQNEDAYHVYNESTSINEQTLKDHPAELEASGREEEAERREELVRRMRELKYIKDPQERKDEEERIRRQQKRLRMDWELTRGREERAREPKLLKQAEQKDRV